MGYLVVYQLDKGLPTKLAHVLILLFDALGLILANF
jgi:hypothetical protein